MSHFSIISTTRGFFVNNHTIALFCSKTVIFLEIMIKISPRLAAELKVICLTAIIILFSSTAVVSQERMTAYAQLQLNADTICVLNPEQCDEARQQEFADSVQRGIEEAQREEYIEE